MRKLVLAFLLLCGTAITAQTVIINGERTNRPLNWDDFAGEPDQTADLYAYTYWYVSYKWGSFLFSKDTVMWNVEVTLELERRSWKKPDKVTPALLEHEQGHFSIGRLCAAAFQQRVNNTIFFRHNYNTRIAEIFNEELAKYRKLESQYDRETEHFHNREQQKKWDLYFKRELDKQR